MYRHRAGFCIALSLAILGCDSIVTAELGSPASDDFLSRVECIVSPDPVVVDLPYVVRVSNLRKGMDVAVVIEDADGTTQHIGTANSDGVFTVSHISVTAGPGTATVLWKKKRSDTELTRRAFDVYPPSACGDGNCDDVEECGTCPDDCGECPPACGDGSCDLAEECSANAPCEADCGPCAPVCGDAICDADEACFGANPCAADCGPCAPVCGDAICDADEACLGANPCAADCGPCDGGGDEPLLIPLGAVWRYLDDGSDQGTVWTETSFDDSGWGAGPAELGYGDGDEATVLRHGGDSSNKHITTYFRHAFSLSDPQQFDYLFLQLKRDDGAVVYLNGTEVFRSAMPAGAITYRTGAESAGCEDCLYEAMVGVENLVAGTNVIAVEVHQRSGSSSDISFDLRLEGMTGEPPAVCGDNLCSGDETCSSCAGDCGVCPPECGDGLCNGDETCESCSADCGACPPPCGDGVCQEAESCRSCAADCGSCPVGSQWSFIVNSDSRSRPNVFADTVRSATTLDPTAIMMIDVGDLTADGAQAQWEDKWSTLSSVVPDPLGVADSLLRPDLTSFDPAYVRYIGVIGNHDVHVSNWLSTWNMNLPGQQNLGQDGVVFSFTYDNAIFISLDTGHAGVDHDWQTSFLRETLASPEGQAATWKFVMLHKPIYPCNDKSPYSKGVDWAAVFEEFGVDIVFIGDSHTFERTCPMIGGHCADGGVIYMNTASSGASPRSVNPTLTRTISSNGRSDSYDCSEILDADRGGLYYPQSTDYFFCDVGIADTVLDLSCYVHDDISQPYAGTLVLSK